MATFDEIVTRLESFAARAVQVEQQELRDLIYDLTQHAKNISHYRSGLMRQTHHVAGVVPVGTGVLEATMQPGVSYAEHEVARGGSHDYASRTIAEQAARIAAAADEIQRRLTLALFEASL